MFSSAPQATAPLEAWLSYLWQQRGERIILGLERIAPVAAALGVTKPAPMVFTVAGTNGKGSTCHILERILLAAGYRVGVYSSPHMFYFTERVRIQGIIPVESAFSAAFAQVEQARGQVELTFFEYTTLMALSLFCQASLDVVILEVGLGGRLDAVNIVDANVAVLTTIGLDHVDRLGPDREQIGYAKAGIFRTQRPAVIGEPVLPQSVIAAARQLGTPLLRRDLDWSFTQYPSGWVWRDSTEELTDLPLPRLPLANAATALAALRCCQLPVDMTAVRSGLYQANLPGRFQIVRRAPVLILDVAHNPHAAAYLAQQLSALRASLPKPGTLHAVVGMLADKDIPGTLACLQAQVERWYCAPLEGPRAAAVEALLTCLPPQTLSFPTITQAWQQAMQHAQRQDVVVVFGSFHAVAPILRVLSTG